MPWACRRLGRVGAAPCRGSSRISSPLCQSNAHPHHLDFVVVVQGRAARFGIRHERQAVHVDPGAPQEAGEAALDEPCRPWFWDANLEWGQLPATGEDKDPFSFPCSLAQI